MAHVREKLTLCAARSFSGVFGSSQIVHNSPLLGYVLGHTHPGRETSSVVVNGRNRKMDWEFASIFSAIEEFAFPMIGQPPIFWKSAGWHLTFGAHKVEDICADNLFTSVSIRVEEGIVDEQ